MADKKISELTAAGALTGAEILELVQGGVNKQTTTQDIADLGGGGGGAVDSVNGQTGVVVLTKSDVGLGNADNTSDANKPVSTAQQTALNLKTDQIASYRTVTGSHTLDSTDLAAINAGDDYVILVNSAGAADITIPLNATVAFVQGMKLTVLQIGAGQVSIVSTGGVTSHSSSDDFIARKQYAPIFLEVLATDEWEVVNGTTQSVITSSGTWTPTLTNTTNVAASTAYACQYLRVGSTVNFSGKFSLDATSTGDTVLGMSIPIPSAFSQEYHAGGVAASHAVQQSAAIFADATNDRLTIRLTITDTTNRDWFFSGSYQII